jgi:squalene cyclase
MRNVGEQLTTRLIGTVVVIATVAHPGPAVAQDSTVFRAAVERAIEPIQRSLVAYPEKRDCFSCHHQAVPVIALSILKSRGFAIDDDAIQSAVEIGRTDLDGALELYRSGAGQGGGATRAGYALWMLASANEQPDETTRVVAEFLLKRDSTLGYWKSSSRRPPSETSAFTSTAAALRSLDWAKRDFGPAEQVKIDERVARARQWLIDAKPVDTEERVFRLWGLYFAHARKPERDAAARDLLETQREDGGWGQTAYRTTDVYATGSALVALAIAGDISPSDPAYRRGAAWLLKVQRPDGTWHVASWSKPFQPYFESGFPHGPDQFISMAGSSWAAAALGLAADPSAP